MNQSIEDVVSVEDDVALEGSEVTEFYNYRNVLITGGSGFLGKLIIHKLLRSCPKLGKLFVLMRPMKSKTPSERLKELFDLPLYENLHREQPNFVNRIIVIEADIGERDLNLSSSDRNFIIENTDIVIHGAAVLRLHGDLRKAIKVNVRGTKLMLELAKKMPRLKAFLYLSTAFSHSYRENIEEKYYEPAISVDEALALIEELDDDGLELLTPKIIGNFVNTYTLSKALGEEVVRLYGTGLPVGIVRPSLVVSTMSEPIKGWIDNIYGPTGILLFIVHLAIFRTMILDTSKIADIIPADYVVNNIIVAAWYVNKQLAIQCNNKVSDEPLIYNCVSSCQHSLTWGDVFTFAKTYGTKVISSKATWYCIFFPTTHKGLHYVYSFFLHWLPVAIIDALAIISGRKQRLSGKLIKILKFAHSIEYFCLHQWKFKNDNVTRLWDRINSTDKKLFNFNVKNIDWRDFFIIYTIGIRVHLLKDPMSNLEASIARYRRLKLAHFSIVGVFVLILLCIILFILWIVGSYL